jgi:arylsulfatase A-like enzyme
MRNALWFSLLKSIPPIARSVVYESGRYWSPEDFINSLTDFLDSYAVLDILPEITIYDAHKSAAIFFTNEATHAPRMLQYPDYVPRAKLTDTGSVKYSESDDSFYHSNMAFYLKFGEWLDELKKNGVYDNSRIIIVSDHGAGVNARIADTEIPIPGERREKYNPLLMVKDFNAHGKLKIDQTFMTNADVPLLALAEITENPRNPFTGKPITAESKKDGAWITVNHLSQAYQHGKYAFAIKPDQWIWVNNNILDPDNWKKENVNDE